MGLISHLPPLALPAPPPSSPPKRKLTPVGEAGSLQEYRVREPAEAGYTGPVIPCLCLGLGKFEGLCLSKSPSNPSQNSFKRESNI